MGISVPSWINVARKPPALHRKTLSQDLQSKASMRGLSRRKVASGQMHLYHTTGLKVVADVQPTNTSQRTRRRILPLGEMTIKMTADKNAEAGLPIDPEGDQEADPGPDVKVTPGAEGTQEVLPIHILLEGMAPAGSPGHNPEPDPSPGLGLTGEDRGLGPIPTDRDQNQGQDQDPGEDVVTIPETVMITDLQPTSIQNRTLSSQKRNIKFNQS